MAPLNFPANFLVNGFNTGNQVFVGGVGGPQGIAGATGTIQPKPLNALTGPAGGMFQFRPLVPPIYGVANWIAPRFPNNSSLNSVQNNSNGLFKRIQNSVISF